MSNTQSFENPEFAKDRSKTWVRETKFGRWFLSSHTWYKYVLTEAVTDFYTLSNGRLPEKARFLDAGCGEGLGFGLLNNTYKPVSIIGVDVDREQIDKAQVRAEELTIPTQALHGDISSQLPLGDGSIDVVFCHQLLHHTSLQKEVLAELYRLLVPGGYLLVGESCRSFIHSLPVRLLFR